MSATAVVRGRGATCTRVRLLPANASGMVNASRVSTRRASYVYGIVLPDVRNEHPNVASEQEEYNWEDLEATDMTDLPVRCNHAKHLAPVGRVYAFDPSPPHANALLELDESVALEPSFARNALLGGAYSSLSLSHKYTSRVTAAKGDPSRLALETNKSALEVSLCDEPGRAGAAVLEFLPSHSAMRNANWHFLSTFAHNYKYPPPPPPRDEAARDVLAPRSPELNDYVDNTLEPLVQRRLDSLFEKRGFVRRSKAAMEESAQRTTNPRADTQQHTADRAAAMSSDAPQDPPAAATPEKAPAAEATGMATDEPPAPQETQPAAAAPPKQATTTSQSELGDLTPHADDPPELAMAKAFAREKQMQERLAAFEKREQEESAARAAAAAEEARKKTDAFKTAAFSAAQQTVANLGLSDEKAAQAGELLKNHAGQCIDKGMTLDEVNNSLGAFGAILVEASASHKQQQEQQQRQTLQSMARQHAEQWSKNKTMAATFSGGSFADPDADVDDKLEQSGKRRATPESSVPESAPNHGFFGLGAVAKSGTVNASKSAAKPAKQQTPTVTPRDANWARTVFESMVQIDEQTGHVHVPTYEEVAHGGVEIVGVVKRNRAGEKVEVQEARPRWREAQKIGPQHLFPELVEKLCAPFQKQRADPDQESTLEMVKLGAKLPQARDEGSRSRGRSSYVTRDEDDLQYSTNFYWVRPELQASGATF